MKKKMAFLIGVFLLVVLCSTSIVLRYKALNDDEPNEEKSVETSYAKEIKYLSNFQEFESALLEQAKVMIVFGKTGCQYCERYIPELEKVLNELDFNIYYIDMLGISKEDRDAITHSDLIVPGKCNSSGVDRTLSKGFGTPLSLIIENGSTIDCIRGYKSAEFVTSTLKNLTE